MENCFEISEYLLDVLLETDIGFELYDLQIVVLLEFVGLLVEVTHAPSLVLVVLQGVKVVVKGFLAHLENYGWNIGTEYCKLSLSNVIESISSFVVFEG